MTLSDGIVGEHPAKTPRSLVKDGVWQVPEKERPVGWENMPVVEAKKPLPCALRELPELPEPQIEKCHHYERGSGDKWKHIRGEVVKLIDKPQSYVDVTLPTDTTMPNLRSMLSVWGDTIQYKFALKKQFGKIRVTYVGPWKTVPATESMAPTPPVVEPILVPEVGHPVVEEETWAEPESDELLSWIPAKSETAEVLLEKTILVNVGVFNFDSRESERAFERLHEDISALAHHESYYREAKRRADALLQAWAGKHSMWDEDVMSVPLKELWLSVHSEILSLLESGDPAAKEAAEEFEATI